MYCLFMYTQRPFDHDQTIITETYEKMIEEMNKGTCCTIKCCKHDIIENLKNLTDQTINKPIHWTDKYHGFCLFLHKNVDGLNEKIYNRYMKDPKYNDTIDFDCSED